jgi:hypothetical protein
VDEEGIDAEFAENAEGAEKKERDHPKFRFREGSSDGRCFSFLR